MDTIEIIALERVCRRFQGLVYSHFSSVKEVDLPLITQSLRENGVIKSHRSVTKYLILTGLSLTKLKMDHSTYFSRSNILHTIARLCPSLESLDVSICSSLNYVPLKSDPNLFSNLKELVADATSGFGDKSLEIILKNATNLEVLSILFSTVNGKSFHYLPSSLKSLSICTSIHKNNFEYVLQKCPNLEKLDNKGLRLSSDVYKRLGRSCPNMKELLIESKIEDDSFFKEFSSLEKLIIMSAKLNLSSFISNICHLPLKLLILDVADLIRTNVDWSKLTNLEELTILSTNTPFDNMLFIESCKTLKYLKIKIPGLTRELTCSLVKGLPQLTSLSTSSIAYCEEFVTDLKKAVRKRENKIKITITRRPFSYFTRRNADDVNEIPEINDDKFELKFVEDDWLQEDFTDSDGETFTFIYYLIFFITCAKMNFCFSRY